MENEKYIQAIEVLVGKIEKNYDCKELKKKIKAAEAEAEMRK